MREILFRGRRSHDKEWVYGNYAMTDEGEACIMPSKLFYMDGHYFGYDNDSDALMSFEQITIGQYTGVIDKNGVKIFEGDIVAMGEFKWKGVVVWDEMQASFLVDTIEDGLLCPEPYLDRTYKTVEVVGNIHEEN